MLVFERGKLEYPEKKTSRSKKRTNNRFNPRMTLGLGIKPRPHWWEASALTTAPPLLPTIVTERKFSSTSPFTGWLIQLHLLILSP